METEDESAKARKIDRSKLKPAKKVKHEVKGVALRIVRKPSAPAPKPTPAPTVTEIDTEKQVAFAMAVIEQMKREERERDAAAAAAAAGRGIQLEQRPTSRTDGQASPQFPKEDLEDFRRRLLAAREEALSGVDAMKSTGFNESEDREADGGDGTNQTLRLQALGQMGVIKRTIQQIDEALHRIDDGTYGVCTVCNNLIRKLRLLNQPFVQTCIECQSAMEREQQNTVRQNTSRQSADS